MLSTLTCQYHISSIYTPKPANSNNHHHSKEPTNTTFWHFAARKAHSSHHHKPITDSCNNRTRTPASRAGKRIYHLLQRFIYFSNHFTRHDLNRFRRSTNQHRSGCNCTSSKPA